MPFDVTLLAIDKIIVHEIPEKEPKKPAPEPVLSNSVSKVDAGIRNYFREKIVGSLSEASYGVVFDSESDSPVPELCGEILAPRSNTFVAHSQDIARHLQNCQTASTSAGLLIVALATIGEKKSLVIMKLEKEAGVRLTQERDGDNVTFNLVHLKDLMLTQKTRVFKVGLFVNDGDAISGVASDHQRSNTTSHEVATFFLKRFLGCELTESSEVSTKRFIELTQAFINEEIEDPKVQARYLIALHSELSSQEKSLKPKAFARRC